jgi:hypothetical protein
MRFALPPSKAELTTKAKSMNTEPKADANNMFAEWYPENE